MPPIRHNHAFGAKPLERCSACDLNRTGPYRLADGTWSDGVDRSERISAYERGIANPNRVRVVIQTSTSGDWYPNAVVLKGIYPLAWDFPTHAEAIAYADKQARTTTNGETK